MNNQSNSEIDALYYEISSLKEQLNKTQEECKNLNNSLGIYKSQLLQAEELIRWFKSSKFWKLREFLVPIKNKFLGSKSLSLQIFREYTSKSPGKGSLNVEVNRESNYKKLLTQLYAKELQLYLCSDSRLELPTAKEPLVSIIIVLFNRCELTFQCLKSLMAQASIPFELIIVDNASSDQTNFLLEKLDKVKLLSNSTNLHFLEAANQGAAIAEGEYLLFLNNDAQLLPHSLQEALNTIQESKDIGAVGGKIVLLDGSLQEAGSVIWRDGSCLGYGRSDNPFEPMYMFQRDVDYCSGAFLLTPRNIFLQYGGFDIDYRPAYYEETDYCLKLWENKLRVVYNPNVALLHFEFASSSDSSVPSNLQKNNQQKFSQKHTNQLALHYSSSEENILLARHAVNAQQKKVLFVDDRVPHAYLGSGYPRSRDILNALTELGYFVTFYPLNIPNESWELVYQDIPKTTEVMVEYGTEKLQGFLQSRTDFYDHILISRPHNMAVFQEIIEKHGNLWGKSKIIYDAEAVYALREIKKHEVLGSPLAEPEAKALIQQELKLARNAHHILAVSELEKKHFENFGYTSVSVLGNTVEINPTPLSFEQREGILFVGAIHDDESPNADSVIWFVREVLPLINEKLSNKVGFTIAGFNQSKKILDLASDQVHILGKVDDLTSLYNSHRIFVAPTRFAAGIPLKVHHAISYGLPIVTTGLIAKQLGLKDSEGLMVADSSTIFTNKCVELYNSKERWISIREYALRILRHECSRFGFLAQINFCLSSDKSLKDL